MGPMFPKKVPISLKLMLGTIVALAVVGGLSIIKMIVESLL